MFLSQLYQYFFDSDYLFFVNLVMFLTAVEAAEPIVMTEADLVHANVLVVHALVVVAVAGYLREFGHLSPTNNNK